MIQWKISVFRNNDDDFIRDYTGSGLASMLMRIELIKLHFDYIDTIRVETTDDLANITRLGVE